MINEIINKQKEYSLSGKCLDLNNRINALKKLKKVLDNNMSLIYKALSDDLGKAEAEAYSSEIMIFNDEINYYLKNIKKLAKTKKVHTPISLFKAKSSISKRPYGVVFVIAPWNYPILLSLSPLIEAIAAGNTVILKPSEIALNSSLVLDKIIKEFNEPHLIECILGDKEVVNEVISLKPDFIFYTGGEVVGKIIAKKASESLIPYALELGGKSPTIITKTANLKLASKRIAFGKLLNLGQTCVAPDYILVDNEVANKFIELLKEELNSQSKDLSNFIINTKHYERLKSYLSAEEIYFGGTCNDEKRYISPTLIINPKEDSKLLSEEIFGPIFPIIIYDDLNLEVNKLKHKDSPLALYLFTEDKKDVEKIRELKFGQMAINDCVMMLANKNLPFGGVGLSGQGSYHGKAGFELFTHTYSVLKTSTKIDLPIRYNMKKYLKLIKKIMK